MASPFFLLPEAIKFAAEVARTFSEYVMSVKQVPKIVRNLTLEVHLLKGVLETLSATLVDNQESTGYPQLSESIAQCQNTLSEVKKLLVLDAVDESPSKLPRIKREAGGSYVPGRDFGSSSPDRLPRESSSGGYSSLETAQTSSGYRRVRATFFGNNCAPVALSTSTPRKRKGIIARLRWPLDNQGKAENLLKDLERHKSQLTIAMQTDNALNLNALKNTVKDIEATLNDGEKRSVLAWLRPKVDMYEFHNEQHDKQEDETCEWLTNSNGWEQWLDGGSSELGGYHRFIWIYGIPGAGKTVLASFLIDDIAKHCRATGFSYYYCFHERDQDETMPFLRWIIGDLSRQIGRYIPKELDDLCQKETFTITGLMDCFSAVSRQFKREGRQVYLVVDAVDESKKPRDRFLDVLTKIGTDPAFEHVSLLMTSRDEPDIRDKMTQLVLDAELDADDAHPRLDDEGYIPEDPLDLAPYTSITMSNGDVMRAIRTYVKKQFARNARFKGWPSQFREKVENELARNARGMFRWVACQIDIIERKYMDRDEVLKTLEDLPETLFDTYARILQSIKPGEQAFARTALALICSNTVNIKSADVLVQASLHSVQHGAIHTYNVRVLKDSLGCLIKITDLKRKPHSIFKREDETATPQRVSLAHYTVREFLFAKPKREGEPRPAGNFALSSAEIRKLEMQVVFNGLQQWETARVQNPRLPPTRYQEHCLEAGDLALRAGRRDLIVKDHSLWQSVLPCLVPGGAHLKALRNVALRKYFQRWRKLFAFDELPPQNGSAHRGSSVETGILASLMLLRWPEFAQKFLQDPAFKNLSPQARRAIWTDEFTIDPSIDETIPKTCHKGELMTVLRLCVLWKQLDFLGHFIDAGAKFDYEPDIIFVALRNPYGTSTGDDGSTTGELLKMLLERGANPNPLGYKFTPLQMAVNLLEEGWVQSLLMEVRDANSIGDPDGEHPYESDKVENWYQKHPLDICSEAKPDWATNLEDLLRKSQKQVEKLLI
ncbi:hypothetical protein GGR54DRAFT_637201 [Hypoxylon sp. NC1633]|nr:hypothetical protein GGR54DRAFT_637201 [Hypoxylon sp. NC1633]